MELQPQIIAFAAEIAFRNDGELPTDVDVEGLLQSVEAVALIERYVPDMKQHYLERRFPKRNQPVVQTLHVSKHR